MSNVFVEPRCISQQNHMSSDEDLSKAPAMSSTPITGRRFSTNNVHSANLPSLFNASPLIKIANERPRAASIAGTVPLLDTSHTFALNNLSKSLYNDSGISNNDGSFVTYNNKTGPKSVRSLQKDLFNETPPGVFYENDEDLAQPHSDEDVADASRNKRCLSDSYLQLKEKSPSVPQMKRSSGEFEKESEKENQLSLPRVPNCFDTSYDRPPLIGDNSREYLLPYNTKCNSEHCDFKCISPSTLVDLIRGKYSRLTGQYLIIDTRYPYEYDGGHVAGGVSVVTKEDMLKSYMDETTAATRKQILIFHCEFSSKRGPSMCRYTRDQDRLSNTSRYPFLFYPEMYILHGGYKEFYEQFPEYCTPQNYVPMLEAGFEEELAHWQRTTKTSAGGDGQSNIRGMKSRTRSQRQLKLS